MKRVREPKANGGQPLRRAAQLPDQDTARISAAQLAEVLARVDGEPSSSNPNEQKRTISGERPIVRPAPTASNGDASRAPASSPSTSPVAGIDLPGGHFAVIERPVDEAHVVNATLPTAPASSGLLVAAAPPDAAPVRDGDVDADVGSATEAEAAGVLLVASARRRAALAAIALVIAVIALASALVLFYRR
ncbi:MAG: hypothetical protein K0S65_6323 [Labilithrix sp.]|nr:hypothetical protein [Labilithrix sp.]